MNYIHIKQNCNMEFLSNKIICSQTKPTEKSFLIGIPMYMYRVQSQGFTSELNFFQEIVLKFKRQPDTSCSAISDMTGLDIRLLERVEGELIRKNLLSEYGSITQYGIELLDNKSHIIIDKETQRMGYVFQYLTQTNYYPYYIPSIREAEIINEEGTLVATDLEDESSVEKLYKINLLQQQVIGNAPSDIEVCHLIENTKHNQEYVEDSESLDGLSKLLSLRFVPNSSPIPVLVCAYIYLPMVNEEEGIYSSEWKVTNPFADGDSEELELYLKSLNLPSLKKKIINEFREADTDINRKYAEVDAMLESEASDEIKLQLGYSFEKLDEQLKEQVKNTISAFIRLQHINNFDYQMPLFGGMQKTIETILANDYHSRTLAYNRLKDVLKEYLAPDDLSRQVNQLTRRQYISNFYKLQKASKGALLRKSMLSQFAAMLLTRQFDCNAPIYNVFRYQIQFIINLSILRNDKSHGGSEKEIPLSEEDKDINSLYNSYIQIVKSYISII